MPDIVAITSALGAIKTATEIVKALREADISLEKAEMKLKLADLMNALADARIVIGTIQEDLFARDHKIKNLEEELSTRISMKYDPPFYWVEKEQGRDGPFCQKCYDENRKPIRLQDYGDGQWVCMVCKHSYSANK